MAVSEFDKKYLSQDDQDRIEAVTKAAESGDMSWDEAHNEAESIRAKASYSGGGRGDQYIDLSGGFGNDGASLKRKSAGTSGGDFSYEDAPQFVSRYQDTIDTMMQDLMGYDYGDFKGGDLYAALAQGYEKNGQKAMRDALGQISARTGGLASSYAGAAAQQAYNDHMSALEELAMSMYLDDYDRKKQNLQLLQGMDDTDFARYQAGLDQFNTDRDFAYGAAADDRNWAYQEDQEEWNRAAERAATMASFGDFSGYKALGYTDAQIALMKMAYDAENAPAADISGPAVGSGGGGYDNNGGISDENIRTMQNYLGVNDDGIWGSQSTDAAGGLSAEEAWEAYQSNTLKPGDLVDPRTGKRFSPDSEVYGPFFTGDKQTGAGNGKTSLDWDEDEGIFSWNGKNYSSFDELANAIDAADLSTSEKKKLQQKFALFGFDISFD